MENRRSQQDSEGKNTWVLNQFLLPAVGAVAVMLVTQITQIYTNDWTKTQKLYFNITIGFLYLFAITIYVLVVAICNARNKGKDIVVASTHIEDSVEKLKIVQPMLEQLNSSIKDFSLYTNELIKSNDLFQYILDRKSVVELESSVGNYDKSYEVELEIYIQSSEFTLEESGDLFEAIMWNLRKGVHYVYMIPNDKIEKYKKMLRRWFRAFSCICVSKEEFNKFQSLYKSDKFRHYTEYWCDEYKRIYNEAEMLWNEQNPNVVKLQELRERCEQLFLELISTYVEEPSLFYVTVALYEIKDSTWEAIVKLPTSDIKEEYYAFKIPGEPVGVSKRNFVETFKSFYKDERHFAIKFKQDIFKWRD